MLHQNCAKCGLFRKGGKHRGLGRKSGLQKAKNASRDAGVRGIGHSITQETLYAGSHFLSSKRLEKVGWGGRMTEEGQPAASKPKAGNFKYPTRKTRVWGTQKPNV